MKEVREIPPATRRVRWIPAMGHRWPLGAFGIALAVYGGLLALMLHQVAGGKASDDRLLGTELTEHAEATILEVKPIGQTLNGATYDQVSYQFAAGSTQRYGKCYAPAGRYVAARGEGSDYASDGIAEFLPDRPEINRLLGGQINVLPTLTAPVLGLIVLPGILFALLWAHGVLDLRRMMSRGDVAVADLTRIEQMRWLVPLTLRIDYRFRDHRAQWRVGRHWVRKRSELGESLLASDRAVLVHDRTRPQFSRLVAPSDFEETRPRKPEGETARAV
ncbi:MAG: hypothetical protein AAF628_20265 [Planctomycetota bacterium]